ncbi:hypothetical protein CRE_00130 [Caenorhabditis remanei]|uniref:DDE-1 domain-containing protein n=1 Tax=Caenorhabditis remanei TaxID=31234 RepID=E3LDA9_CAERE|nr:hypothetical protein CRE_00130 [Caenorhabditis remanei]
MNQQKPINKYNEYSNESCPTCSKKRKYDSDEQHASIKRGTSSSGIVEITSTSSNTQKEPNDGVPSEMNDRKFDFDKDFTEFSLQKQRPKIYGDQLTDYFLKLEKYLKGKKYEHIYACGELKFCFDSIYDNKELPGFARKKINVTVILTARSDGAKNHSIVILPDNDLDHDLMQKSKNILKKKFGSEFDFSFSPDSNVNTEIIKTFLSRNYWPSNSLLVWNSNAENNNDDVKKHLLPMHLDALFVPEDLEEMVQPLNVYWKSKFMANMRENYEYWRKEEEGNQLSLTEILEWIQYSWGLVPKKQIVESFVGCGLTGWPEELALTNIHCFKNEGSLSWVDYMERERLKMFKESAYKQLGSRFRLNIHGRGSGRPWPLPKLVSPPQPSTSNNNGSGISETASTSSDTDGVAEDGVASEFQKKDPEISVTRCIHSFLNLEKELKDKGYRHIYACGEMKFCLNSIPEYGLAPGEKHKKIYVTILFAACSDGERKIPLVIFPKNGNEEENVEKLNRLKNEFCDDLLNFALSPDSDVNTEIIKQFLSENDWKSNSLLVFDSNTKYNNMEVKKHAASLQLNSLFIPEDAVEMFQPAYVYWKPTVMKYMREKYDDWFERNQGRPLMSDFLKWIGDSWDIIRRDEMFDSFVGCGFSGWPKKLPATKIHCFENEGSMVRWRPEMHSERSKMFNEGSKRQDPCFEVYYYDEISEEPIFIPFSPPKESEPSTSAGPVQGPSDQRRRSNRLRTGGHEATNIAS